MSTLTPDERARIRYHLGYQNVQSQATFVLGVPSSLQTGFILESAFDKIILAAETKVREVLCALDQIEANLIEDFDVLGIKKVDEIEFDTEAMQKLRDKAYMRWRSALGSLFGVPPNPYDPRFAISAVNIPVRHGF